MMLLLAAAFVIAVLFVMCFILYTRHKRLQRQIKQSEFQPYQEPITEDLSHKMPKSASFWYDREHGTLTWTESFFLIIERDPDSIGPNVEDFISLLHAEDKHRIRSLLLNLSDHNPAPVSKKAFECRILTKDGRIKYIRFTSLQGGSTNRKGLFIGFLQDITEETIANNILSGTRSLLAGITNNSLDAIMTIVSIRDSKGEIFDFVWTLINPAAEQLLGKAADELITRSILQESEQSPLLPLFDKFLEVLESGISQRFEYPWSNELNNRWLSVAIVKLGDGLVVTLSDITEQKQMLEELRFSEQKLRALLNTSTNLFILLNTRQKVLVFNSISENVIRNLVDKEIRPGEDIRHIIPEPYLDQHNISFESALNGNIIIEDRNYFLKDRTYWFHARYLPAYNETGAIVGVSILMEDITTRKYSEDRLLASEATLKEVQRLGKIAGFEINFEEQSVHWSPEVARIVERPMCELPQTLEDVSKFIHPQDIPSLSKLLDRTKEGHEESLVEYRILMPDDTPKYISSSLKISLNSNGEPARLIGFIQDISERRLAEEQRRQSEELYRKLVEASPDAIAVLDLNGRFISCNVQHAMMFGVDDPVKMIGKHAGEFLSKDEQDLFESVKKNVYELPVATIEVEIFRGDGSKIIKENNLVLLRDSGGDPTGILVVGRDITERKRFEQDLILAKEYADAANRTKSEFIANISHEIRTPMNAILGFAEILREQITDFRLDSYIQGINVAAKNLLNLINDILDISKIEAGRLEIHHRPMNPFKLIVELQQTFFVKTQQKDLNFEIFTDDTLPEQIILDEIRLRQILINLLSNAIKFTEEGFVKLIIHALPLSEVENSHIAVTFEVHDSGIGISEEQQGIIFEPFRQQDGQDSRRFGGTGLGLTICKRLAEMMGGHITVQSAPGKGAIFSVYFPDVSVIAEEQDFVQPLIAKEFLESTIDELEQKVQRLDNIGLQNAKQYEHYNNTLPQFCPPELLQVLEKECRSEWESVKLVMNNLDVERFAERLIELSDQYDFPLLYDYSIDLYTKTSSFKLTEMNLAFEEFPHLLTRLRTLLPSYRSAEHHD